MTSFMVAFMLAFMLACIYVCTYVCVYAHIKGSNAIRRTVCSATGIDERSWQGDVAAAVGTASIVTYLGLQPIEKKLVMDQLLEEQGHSKPGAAQTVKRGNPLIAPIREIYQYANTHGIRALYGGATPLLMRELCYITAITIANPLVTSGLLLDNSKSFMTGCESLECVFSRCEK